VTIARESGDVTITRRGLVAGGLCACAVHAGRADALDRVRPMAMEALAPPGFRPVDADERGLWQSLERLEAELASSNLLLQSPAMQAYTEAVMANLLGPRAKEARVYLVRNAEFNASMAPNGMMIVHSGLIARVRDEAQFATVLGHECGHYLRRHSLQQWRNQKTKTGIMAFVTAGATLGAGVAMAVGGDARSWVDLANSVNGSLALSILRFSREQESEADAYGIRLIDQAGYPPEAAAQIWSQLVAERRASAAVRGKRYRDGSTSAWSTHPPTAQRMLDLTQSAQELVTARDPQRRYDARRAAWQRAVAPLRATLLEEQIALNDPGASLYLVEALAEDGWTGPLHFYRGEAYRLRDAPGDAERAAQCYGLAVALPDAPPVAWRANGYALIRAGRGADGARALSRYLDLAPAAPDAAMVRYALQQQVAS
jgi:Zn-dependent protease with chaperone function